MDAQASAKSTKGASKQRREQINREIDVLKELLPLPAPVRQRLFQLQVMCLGCIYIRKERFLPHLLRSRAGRTPVPHGIDIYKTVHGFLLLMTRQGKLLYLSENVSDYLGHSAEEILSQGDNLYDLIDPRDQEHVQAELLGTVPSRATLPETRVFMCRMNLTRAAKRQPHYQKFIIMQGCYLQPVELYQSLLHLSPHHWLQPVFAAFCTPLITPDTADYVSAGNSAVFCAVHHMDMRLVYLDDVGMQHLGYPRSEVEGKSWYAFLSPHDLLEAGNKHRLLCEEKESSTSLLVRFRSSTGWLWLYTVLSLKEDDSPDEEVKHMILATYQLLSDVEALTLKASGWLQIQAPKVPKVVSLQPDMALPDGDEEYSVKVKRKFTGRSVGRGAKPPHGWPEIAFLPGQFPAENGHTAWRPEVGPPTPQTPSQLSPAVHFKQQLPPPLTVMPAHPLTPDDSPEHHGVCHPQLPQKPATPPLPIIEPTDLEAYLEEVERDGTDGDVPLPVECHSLPGESGFSPPKNLFTRRCSENLGQISHAHFRHAGRLSFSGGCG